MNPNSINMAMKTKSTNIRWTYYLIELMVVFVGVTAGFLLNNWREDTAELKLERRYLESFYADVKADAIDLDSLIFHSQVKEETLIGILKESALIGEQLSEELAKALVKEIMFIEWFTPANDTYEDIINSGNLNIISDYTLKEKISSYYSFLNEVANVEQFYSKHMDSYGFPILYKTYHLLNQEFISKESYQSLEFTNMYLGVLALLQQNIRVYREALEKNKELETELAKALGIE
ncbi:hypothetical protein ACFLS7_00865 [Bacteroidota bacterium]